MYGAFFDDDLEGGGDINSHGACLVQILYGIAVFFLFVCLFCFVFVFVFFFLVRIFKDSPYH